MSEDDRLEWLVYYAAEGQESKLLARAISEDMAAEFALFYLREGLHVDAPITWSRTFGAWIGSTDGHGAFLLRHRDTVIEKRER